MATTETGVAVSTREEHLPAQPTDPAEGGDLVRFAIEKGVDVAVLERLVALQERVTERNARAAYFEALANFQEECPDIRKSGKANIATRSGGSYEYTFAPLDEITNTIRPILRKYGLSYAWDVPSLDGGVMQVVCVLRHIDGHEERASFPVPIDTAAAMSGAQKNGAALTYGRRQSLIAVLGLTTTDRDTDAAEKPSVGTITETQAADLEALADEVGADKKKFLAFIGVESFSAIRVEHYRQAMETLERKRGAR